MYRKLVSCLALITAIVALGFIHYYHLDDRLLLVLRELNTPNSKRQSSIWLSQYTANIQAKPISELRKAETSGLTWHAASNTLFTITGKIPKLVQLSPNGDILRAIKLTGVHDTEAITTLNDGRFVIVEEQTANLIIFSLSSGNHLDLTTALRIDLSKLDKGLLEDNNKGLEGIAWDAINLRFILAKERTPTQLYSLDFDPITNTFGNFSPLDTITLPVNDISGLELDTYTNNLILLSHKSNIIIEFGQNLDPISFMSLSAGLNGLHQGINQAEGIALDNNGTIYIVGEPNLFYSFKPNTTKYQPFKYNSTIQSSNTKFIYANSST